jgi:putative addiction module component (TIGR02574 family)
MSKPVPLPPPGFDDLSVDDQIAYVQSLWDRIAATPDQVPVPEWHRDVLDERLKDYKADPEARPGSSSASGSATSCATASNVDGAPVGCQAAGGGGHRSRRGVVRRTAIRVGLAVR